jgi:hypothetical protein
MEKKYTARDLYLAFVVGREFTKSLPPSIAESYGNAVKAGLQEADEKKIAELEEHFDKAMLALES